MPVDKPTDCSVAVRLAEVRLVTDLDKSIRAVRVSVERVSAVLVEPVFVEVRLAIVLPSLGGFVIYA